MRPGRRTGGRSRCWPAWRGPTRRRGRRWRTAGRGWVTSCRARARPRRRWPPTSRRGPTRRRWPPPPAPGRGPFRPGVHGPPHRHPAGEDGQADGGGGRVPPDAGDQREVGRRQPRRRRVPPPTGGQPHEPRRHADEAGKPRRRRPRTAGGWRSWRSWPPTTPPSPTSASNWRKATTTSPC